jgi:hypothetical protein
MGRLLRPPPPKEVHRQRVERLELESALAHVAYLQRRNRRCGWLVVALLAAAIGAVLARGLILRGGF